MAGTREGGLKAAQTNKAKNPNYYAEIGSKSWEDPERSHVVGFAKDPEMARAAGRKGGKKINNEEKYEDGTEEALTILQEALRSGSEVGE